MGYDDLDRALIDAWERAYHKYKDNPAELDRVLRRFGGPTYTRPLRSWSLVLRANDKRIDDNNTQGLVRMDRARIEALCSPVVIDYPGVSLDEAALRFGVNRTTVARWASPGDGEQTWWQAVRSELAELGEDPRFGRPGIVRITGRRLMLEHEVNRANPIRGTTRVWTPDACGIDPAGEVWSADWGELRVGLADRVPDGFDQQLERVDRALSRMRTGPSAGGRPVPSRVMQWVCPVGRGGCGRLVYKLYLPMPVWTLVRVTGGTLPRPGAGGLAFLCHRCAGLLYESAERTSSPGVTRAGRRRRVDTQDRLIKRISGGVLTGQSVSKRP